MRGEALNRHLTEDELALHYYGEMTDEMEARTLAHLDPSSLEVKDVALHVVETSVADAADRLEHGRDDA